MNLDDRSLRQAAEREFGIEFSGFDRLSVGNSSINFRATVADGKRLLVKFCCKNAWEKARLVDSEIKCPLVGKMAFEGRSFLCGERMCFAYDWIEDARSIRPQDMTPKQIRSLAEAYGRLSDALKEVNIGGGNERPIHGDLHYDNVFFRENEVVAFFDFEMMRRGLPTEDLVRLFCHRLERTRIWNVMTIHRLYAVFQALVRVCPYPKSEWIEAIERAERSKRTSRLRKRNSSILASVENILVSWIYRRLKRSVEKVWP